MITEILEEDFRKLNLKGYKHTRDGFIEVDLNKELDENVEYWLKNEPDDLKYPVTIAIHNIRTPDVDLHDCYFDKFMDCYSGPKTYEIGMGLRHIYTNRDYYLAHEDYWRVRKVDTKVVYRIYLDRSRFDK